MDFKILSKKEEPLLSRTRVESEVLFDKSTPSKTEIRNALVKELGKEEKLIVVDKVITGYGVRKAKNVSYAYENEEVMKALENKPKENDKGENAKEAPKAEKPESKGAVKEEKPVEKQEAKKKESQHTKEAAKKAENKEETKEQKQSAEEKKQ